MQITATTVAEALMQITRSRVRESARTLILGTEIAEIETIDANAQNIDAKIKTKALLFFIAVLSL